MGGTEADDIGPWETEHVVPRSSGPSLKRWTVGGGLVEQAEGLLLVRNVRRGGHEDWTPPGGVIDADETLLSGLTREVAEETGIAVQRWDGPLYEVRAHAPDMGWMMHAEVYCALEFEGELCVGDPDEIVAEAAFVPLERCLAMMASCAPWVREPLAEWLETRWDSSQRRVFFYEVRGTRRDHLEVHRTAS